MAYNDGIEIEGLDYGADSYNIYRKSADTPEDEFVLVASVTDKKYKDTDVEKDVLYIYQIRAVNNGVEQTEYLKETKAGISTEYMLEQPPKIKIRNDSILFDTDAIVCGYNYAEECWEVVSFFDEDPRECYDIYCKDGKYRFAFYNNNNGMKTPIDDTLVDYEWYDKKVDFTATLKDKVITVSFPSVGEEVEKYEIYVDSQTKTIVADGSDMYSADFKYTSTENDIVIYVYTQNGDEVYTYKNVVWK